jgi:hypothetical protein
MSSPAKGILARAWAHHAFRYTLQVVTSIALPALWYIGLRAWFETGTGPLHSILAPQSPLALVWPLLAITVAWWVLAPKPLLTAWNLIVLPLLIVVGMSAGVVLGLAFTCEQMNRCM